MNGIHSILINSDFFTLWYNRGIVLKICNETNHVYSERMKFIFRCIAGVSIVELNTSLRFYDVASDNYSICVSTCSSTMLSLDSNPPTDDLIKSVALLHHNKTKQTNKLIHTHKHLNK